MGEYTQDYRLISIHTVLGKDVLLLRAVGLRPIVVHGGGPDITRALERLGAGTPEFIDGVRVTPAADLKVVEMVLTGSINTELVTLLNRNGALAIGLSGKDAALLSVCRNWTTAFFGWGRIPAGMP